VWHDIRIGDTPNVTINLDEAKLKMDKTIQLLEEQLKGIRRSSISAGFIETVKVPYYGQMTPIRFIGIVGKCQNGITITPHDSSLVNGIAKFLQDENLLNAYAFSKTTVVISIPPANTGEIERVKNHIKKLGEDSKISIRNLRKSIRKSLSKEELKEAEKDLQILTDEACNKIEEMTHD
jgi:ribosome recycling factor